MPSNRTQDDRRVPWRGRRWAGLGGAIWSLLLLPLGALAAQPVRPVSPDSSTAWRQRLDTLLCVDRSGEARMHCPPQQLAQAEQLMAHVDAFGQAARQVRIQMHQQLAQAYIYNLPHDVTDNIGALPPARRAHLEAHLRAALHVFAETPHYVDGQEYHTESQLYWQLLNWVIANQRPDSVAVVVAQAQAALARYDTTQQAKWYIPWRTRTKAQLVNDRVADGLMGHWYNYRLQGGAVPAPRLHAEAWFPAPGRPKGDTIRPVPGKVNLICTGGQPITDTTRDGSSWDMLRQPYLTALIRRWLQKYGAQNLEVTLIYPAEYDSAYHNMTVEWAQARWTGPGQGAERWRRYIQDHEHLPVTVAVQTRRPTWREDENGRRVSIPTLQFNDFWMHDPHITHTYDDRRGEVVYRNPPWHDFPLHIMDLPFDSAHPLGPADFPGQCVIVGKDGTMEHSSIEPDWLVNTQAAMNLLFDGPGAPPRPGQQSWVNPY